MRSRAAAPTAVPPARPLRLRAAMRTDVGLVRERNEDYAFFDPDLQLYLVADGIGGHQAGDVASAMAVDLVRRRVETERDAIAAFATAPSDQHRRQLKEVLAAAVREAHHAIRERAERESDKRGMGSTLELALVVGREVLIGHVGDSRTYLVRRELASQLTRDHTMAQVQVMAGTLSPEEAATSPLASVIVNAVGVASEVTVDVVHLELRDGDRLLLCSDGLYDYFTREELAERLARGTASQRLAELVDEAKARGGHDNITGVVIEVTATGLPLTARMPALTPSAPAEVEARERRLVAQGTAPPQAPLAPVADPWEEETTLPRSMPPPGAPRPSTSEPELDAPRNPLAAVTEDALSGFVEYSLYEESRPYDVPIEPG